LLSLSQRFVDARYSRSGLDEATRRNLIQALRAFRIDGSRRA